MPTTVVLVLHPKFPMGQNVIFTVYTAFVFAEHHIVACGLAVGDLLLFRHHCTQAMESGNEMSTTVVLVLQPKIPMGQNDTYGVYPAFVFAKLEIVPCSLPRGV